MTVNEFLRKWIDSIPEGLKVEFILDAISIRETWTISIERKNEE